MLDVLYIIVDIYSNFVKQKLIFLGYIKVEGINILVKFGNLGRKVLNLRFFVIKSYLLVFYYVVFVYLLWIFNIQKFVEVQYIYGILFDI